MPPLNAALPLNKPKISALTCARFGAALFVVLFHTYKTSGFSFAPRVARLLASGYTSVSFFFILSGYILAAVYLKGGREIDRRRFWVARFARVYPLFFLGLVADTPWYLWNRLPLFGMHTALLKVAKSFAAETLMLNAWPPYFNWINYPGWSLSDEAFFYAIFTFAGVALWRLRPKVAFATAVGLYLARVSLSLIGARFEGYEMMTSRLPLLLCSEFLLGIMACRWQAAGGAGSRVFARWSTPVVVFCVAAYCLLETSADGHLALLRFALRPLIQISLLLALSNATGVLGRVFSNKVLVLLGEASFALYLLHVPVWHAFEMLQWTGSRLYFVLYLALLIALSVCSFLFFESPMRVWVIHRFGNRDKEGPLVSSLTQ
jgi:peptidoglycan/LPS O-acetylase OafA/YrhL